MTAFQIRDEMKGIICKFQLTSKCKNLYMKRNSVLQYCYRIQLLLGFIAVLCNVILIPKHYNTYMANIDKAIKEDVELKIQQRNTDLEAERQKSVYYSGQFEYELKDDMDTYDYEFTERTLNGNWTQTTIVKGPPREQKKIIHETVRFDCIVMYDPSYDLTVEWWKNNEYTNVNEDDPRFTVDRASIRNQALTITDLTYGDAGKIFENL